MQRISIFTTTTLLFFSLTFAIPATAQTPVPAQTPASGGAVGNNAGSVQPNAGSVQPNAGSVKPFSKRIENVFPDIAQRECSHILTYYGDWLVEEHFEYVDGSTKNRKFLPISGRLCTELETFKSNDVHMRLTVYQDDGIGKEKVTALGPKSKVQTTLYHTDGKTARQITTTDSVSGGTTEDIEYRHKSGKVALKVFKRWSSTFYEVYNNKGKEIYRQTWLHFSSDNQDLLLLLVETRKDGTRRQIDFTEKMVHYFKKDGTLEKSVPYDANTETISPEHLKIPETPEP